MKYLRDPWWSDRTARTALLTGVLLSLGVCSRLGPKPSPGVVVESLGGRGAGARAGLHTGDVLLSWRRPAAPPGSPKAAAGVLRSCMDVAEVEAEQAPRHAVELRFQRQGEISTVEIPAGDWRLEVRPQVATGPEAAGCAAYARARRAVREGRRSEALQWFQEAGGWARQARRARFAALVLQERSEVSLGREDFTAMESDLHESLRLVWQAAPKSLMEATAWHLLGRMERRRAAFAAAEPDLRQALALRTRLAPDSLERAATLNNLGIIAMGLGDLARARPLYLQALGLIQRRAPGSLDEGQLLNNLGLLARASGDSAMAETYFVQANHILQRVEPEGEDLARNRTNLAAIASDRGDLALAEEYDPRPLQPRGGRDPLQARPRHPAEAGPRIDRRGLRAEQPRLGPVGEGPARRCGGLRPASHGHSFPARPREPRRRPQSCDAWRDRLEARRLPDGGQPRRAGSGVTTSDCSRNVAGE